MDTPERLPRLSASSKAWPEPRCEKMGVRDLFGSVVPARRLEKGVQTCGKPDSLLSALQHRRVTRLQEQVERLQQRTVELEEEKGQARKQFQDRLQQVHESWQDCFERHQHSWAKSKADAQAAWDQDREHLQAQIAQLSHALASSANSELMEDAAVQAGIASSGNKSRSSQTPRPNTPNPSHQSKASWDLSRAQSLPQDCSFDWASEASKSATESSSSLSLDFGNAVAAYASQAGNLTSDGYSLAASSFADAAATYAASLVKASPQLPLATPDKESPAPGLYVASPGRWTSFNSCSSESSFGSAESAADNCFLPLEEEEEEEASPVPDQAWWEEFGEFESAPQPGAQYTQPRLVIDNDILRLPVRAAITELAPGHMSKCQKPEHASESGSFWTMGTDAASVTRPMVPRLDLSRVLFPHSTRESQLQGFGQQLADDGDIWHTLEQPTVGVAPKATCNAFDLCIEDSDEGSGAAWLQHTRFPTPSSNPRGMQGSAALPLLEAPCFTRAASSGWGLEPRRVSATITSNPWGLQEAALPMLEISHPEGATEAEVTYTPVEELLADATRCGSTMPEANSVPVSFIDDAPVAEVTMEVMDMSVGDLVSVGGPDICPWDGTSSAAQHSTSVCFSTSSNVQAGEDVSRSAAQNDQADVVEQAVQTEATLAGQSTHSMRTPAAPTFELPLNCRVAARVSTKLPPLDHDHQLPALPEHFILPPEMHPVLGKYSYQGTQATQTSPTRSSHAFNSTSLQAVEEGKWLHCKRAAPHAASGDLLVEAAARAGLSIQEYLAPTQLNSIVQDMMDCTVDNSSYLPFTNRLCDSGFMTCQLAQLLAPIKSASAPLSSVTSEAAAAVVKDAGKAGGAAEQEAAEFEAAAAAVASAEADEAALDAAADALLTQLGLMASEHATADPACGLDSASDTASEFEYISVADAEHQEESASRKRSAREDWPQAGLTKQAKGVDASASAVDFHSAGVDSSLRSSASAPSAVLTNLAGNEQSCEHRSASVVSLADVNLELEHAAPAVCLAAAESADDDLMTDYAESSFESVTSSVASFESLEAMSEVQREREPSGEWEML